MNGEFMREALKEAYRGMDAREGGPFGAVIVMDNEVIARGHNRVLVSADPTAHAEISAIREACGTLKTYDLSGSVIYTTCEPCPMCFGAILWARIGALYSGCTREDAMDIGFDDSEFYRIVCGETPFPGECETEVLRDECRKLFTVWTRMESKQMY
ncbi:MAG: nucleoside deaminase [Spirochaetia bacterium]